MFFPELRTGPPLFLQVLLGESPPPLSAALQPSEAGLAVIAEVSAVQARYWSVLGHQEIQVHPIISGEEEDEQDSLVDSRSDLRINSNGTRTRECHCFPTLLLFILVQMGVGKSDCGTCTC